MTGFWSFISRLHPLLYRWSPQISGVIIRQLSVVTSTTSALRRIRICCLWSGTNRPTTGTHESALPSCGSCADSSMALSGTCAPDLMKITLSPRRMDGGAGDLERPGDVLLRRLPAWRGAEDVELGELTPVEGTAWAASPAVGVAVTRVGNRARFTPGEKQREQQKRDCSLHDGTTDPSFCPQPERVVRTNSAASSVARFLPGVRAFLSCAAVPAGQCTPRCNTYSHPGRQPKGASTMSSSGVL